MQLTLETVISVQGNEISISRKYPNRSVVNKFTCGQIVDFDTVKAGQAAKCATMFDGETLIIKAMERDYTHTCRVEDGKLVETITVRGKNAIRVSSKVGK